MLPTNQCWALFADVNSSAATASARAVRRRRWLSNQLDSALASMGVQAANTKAASVSVTAFEDTRPLAAQ